MARKIRGCFCERKLRPKASFDRRSFRWVPSGRSWVLIGCPKGKWTSGRCKTGTQAYVVLSANRRRCKGSRVCKGGAR